MRKMKRHTLFSTNTFLFRHSLSLQKYTQSINSSLQNRHFHRRKLRTPVNYFKLITEIESENKFKATVGINNNNNNNLPNCEIREANCGWRGQIEALKNDKARFSKLHEEDANVKSVELQILGSEVLEKDDKARFSKLDVKSVGLQHLCSQVFENDKVGFSEFDENANVKRWRIITEESIGLQPLCSEIVAYFAERMISRDTLQRNGVMQKSGSEEVAIAFPYRRNGVLVSCKYWNFHHKRYWQEKETEKILYGVDDIRDTDDIIIVEGEIDKLSMEEAGFPNCVSVPHGAPSKISKTVPSEEKDKKFQYLWNCKKYLGKASRIILATDGDGPGQALAEELARRLGRERCWRIKWPKKKENEVCKDANEVLMHLGPRALHEVINQAEFCPISGLLKFSDFFEEIDEYYHASQVTKMDGRP